MPYYVYLPDGKGSYIQRGPYLNSGKADSRKDKMEEETSRDGEVKFWSTWDPNRAKKCFKDELVDRVGVDQGMRRFSGARDIPKEKDARPRKV